jgi:hypothetical protein
MSIEAYPSPNGVLTSLIWRKTMSGGETSLSGYDNASQALSYTPGQEQVYLNGILLVRGDDYTATNGTSITGLSALAASDFVQINCYNNYSVATTPATSITGTIANDKLANSSITINGSAISLGGSVTLAGDIESVTASSPLTGGGSTGALTVGIQSASTTQAGAVQLSDSTSTTSSVLAATPTAVKSAYDLANGAIPKTLTTTTGDIIYASGANTPARLGIGSTNQVLKVSGGLPTWANNTEAYSGAWTLAATGSLTGASVTVSGLSGKRIAFFLKDFSGTSDGPATLQINGLNNYYYFPTGRYSSTSITLTSYIGATDGTEWYTGAIIDMAGSSMTYKPITVQQQPSGSASYSIGGWYGPDANPVTSLTFDINGNWDAGTYFIYQEN